MELIKEQGWIKFVQNSFNTFIMLRAYEMRHVSLQQVHISMQNKKSGLLSTEKKKKPLIMLILLAKTLRLVLNRVVMCFAESPERYYTHFFIRTIL